MTIHELGHNLGFRHSGFNSEDYGDESGYMGFTVYQEGAPLKCFNGHKNWISGWFEDREYAINPAMPSPVLARLVTFVDYKKDLEENDVVLIRVGRYYVQYNRAKGANIDTGLHADKVSITFAEDAISDSKAIVGLGDGQMTSLPNFRNTGYNLVVEVCEFGTAGEDSSEASLAKQFIFGQAEDTIIDYAWVSFNLDDGMQQSQCFKVGRPETQQPSLQPTSSRPSLSPSIRPTVPPTLKPTLQPTPSPITDNRRPADNFGLDYVAPERLQKKQQLPTTKDLTKLSISNESDGNVRRRLKGTRYH